jgi:hypothetical protein
MRWPIAALLGLGCACSRLPNPTPLGGEEWVPREATPDRKPQSRRETNRRAEALAEAPARPSIAEAFTPGGPAPSSSAPSHSGATGSAHFIFKPFALGDKVELTTRYLMQGSAMLPGIPTAQHASLESKERIAVKVTELSGGALREVEVEYLDSEGTVDMGGAKSSDSSNKGKRYRVSFAGDTPKVTSLTGATSEDEEKGVVFDLFSVSGYLPLVQKELPATLNAGWNKQLGARELERVFGKLEAVRIESAWLKLGDRDPARPDVWNFECGLPVRLERDGTSMRAELKGSMTVRATDTRPLELSLRGPLTAELDANAPLSGLSGTIEVHISQTYSSR